MTNYDKALETAVPSVHLNGTSRGELLDQYRKQHSAVEQAMRVIADSYPHQRDYYVQGPINAFTVAKAKHASRISRLEEIAAEIETDYQNFLEANPEKP